MDRGDVIIVGAGMTDAPDLPTSGVLRVRVGEDLTLDGGTWHLTTDQQGVSTARISPPAVPMFQPVVDYLGTKQVGRERHDRESRSRALGR